ncbi:MAG: nucleoside deaminase [Acidobacteria bacterium]|nr:nucleoside deaminase [Acidobacteriota bacterium]
MRNDEHFMRRCLQLGRAALIAGDAPVGSLIVVGGKIIAEGIESVKSKNDPTAHAEIEAVRVACDKFGAPDLRDATLYTNVEPCVMCAFAIRQTGVRAVVFGLANDRVGGASSKYPVLTASGFPAKHAPPEIRAGVLLAECENLQRDFENFKSQIK